MRTIHQILDFFNLQVLLPLFFLLLPLLTNPTSGFGFDKRLQAGVLAGYSGTYYKKDIWPNVFDGLVLGGHLEYGINRVFAVSVDGSVDLHLPQDIYEQGIGIDDEGNEVLKWTTPMRVTKYFHSSGAVSVLYAIDLFKIVPVFSVGAVATRVDRTIEGKKETKRAFGIRIGGGFEYYLERFSFGAGVYSDRYIGGNSRLVNRIFLTLKGAVVFDLGAKSLE